MSPPAVPPRTWTREVSGTTYTISTDSSLIQLDALNEAFASDMVYWAKPLSPDALKLCVEQSLCFGLYAPKEGNAQDPEMVGLARLVTDYTTFGYLTDVYVLPTHQGRGLGKWLVRCVDEVLAGWPNLRRCLLFTRDAAAVRMYAGVMGMKEIKSKAEGEGGAGGGGGGLYILAKDGGGNVFRGGEDRGGKEGDAGVGTEE